MARHLLVINESQLQRRIISGFVLSELGDMVLEMAASPEEALAKYQVRTYDLILSTMELEGMTGLELKHHARRHPLQKNTPFVIITSTATKDRKERLCREGADDVLFTPFSAEELARVINRIGDPRDKRRHARYNIPGATVRIRYEGEPLFGEVLNLSQKGLLAELEYRRGFMSKWGPGLVDLDFPEEFKKNRAEGILAVICRAEVYQWKEGFVPWAIRAAWQFIDVPQDAQEVLDEVLRKMRDHYSMNEEMFSEAQCFWDSREKG